MIFKLSCQQDLVSNRMKDVTMNTPATQSLLLNSFYQSMDYGWSYWVQHALLYQRTIKASLIRHTIYLGTSGDSQSHVKSP